MGLSSEQGCRYQYIGKKSGCPHPPSIQFFLKILVVGEAKVMGVLRKYRYMEGWKHHKCDYPWQRKQKMKFVTHRKRLSQIMVEVEMTGNGPETFHPKALFHQSVIITLPFEWQIQLLPPLLWMVTNRKEKKKPFHDPHCLLKSKITIYSIMSQGTLYDCTWVITYAYATFHSQYGIYLFKTNLTVYKKWCDLAPFQEVQLI